MRLVLKKNLLIKKTFCLLEIKKKKKKKEGFGKENIFSRLSQSFYFLWIFILIVLDFYSKNHVTCNIHAYI